MGSPRDTSISEKHLVALGRTLQTIREEETTTGLVAVALSYLKSNFHYPFQWLGLYDRFQHALIGAAGITPNDSPVPLLNKALELQPGDIMEQVVIQQRPVGAPDLREEPRAGQWREIAQKLNIQGTIIFPIRYRNQCMGVAVFGSQVWGVTPQSEEKARLSMLLGELAAALYRIEEEQHRQQVKNPSEPLFNLLNRLRQLPHLQQRIEAVVEETQGFIELDRTSIYWFDPHRRCFQRRVSRQKGGRLTVEAAPVADIPVEDVRSFYQSLVADQVVAVGEAKSSLKADMTVKLMQIIQARSLLAAPILYQDQLLGFLSVEGNEGKIWTDLEKNYVRSAGQLIALTAPLETMEDTIQQIKLDQALSSEISRAIFNSDDWNATLKGCAEHVCQHLKVERFLVLLYDEDQENFELCYQHHPAGRKALPPSLDRLNQVDWQMLERSTEAVGIENLADDLKLMAWREPLLSANLQSLLVCSTAPAKPLEGVVVLGHESTRTWNRPERDVLRVVSQQIGLILHQWQLQRQTDHQQKMSDTLQWGLHAMQKISDPTQLEMSAVQNLANVMQVPLVALVTWEPGQKTARISASSISNNKFTLNTDRAIGVYTDPLMQWVLQTDGLLPMNRDELATETLTWLNGSGIGQVIGMALRTTDEYEPTGVLILGDRAERYWPERYLNTFSILVNQLAWVRRYMQLVQRLSIRRSELERLNWYKQRRLKEIYRMLGNNVKRLNDMLQQKDAPSGMRYQQTVRQLGEILSTLVPILKQEQWALQIEQTTIPLASLLRRALERVDPLIKQRQIWSQVHNEEALIIGGDIPKLEFVLYEVLAFACRRSPNNGRLDVWCRPLDANWLELSITDHGVLEPRLVEELYLGQPLDLLAPSTLDRPPGLHLAICQSLMKLMGCEFNLYILEDGRALSRLTIPISDNEL
ncbi:MAG: GAF domain-containing protein [Synechococcales cyanobacterium T60_A2020_003]|nr:GAF domain-containing protein [Synechococcales cyanobacterium T60_A2020_003]